MNKLLFWFCCLACLSACAFSTRMPYQVNSTPAGAQIYVNGVSMGIAPLQIELRCDKRWYCSAANSHCRWLPSDYAYEVTAIKENPELSQTKHVNPCRLKDPRQIHFELGSDAVASGSADVTANQKEKTTSPDDTGRALANSTNQGVSH